MKKFEELQGAEHVLNQERWMNLEPARFLQ